MISSPQESVQEPEQNSTGEGNGLTEDVQVVSQEEEEDEEEDEEEEEEEDDNQTSSGISLTNNHFYQSLASVLEDENGNNILEYISLLHTELIGVNKNLRTISKSMQVLASSAEKMSNK